MKKLLIGVAFAALAAATIPASAAPKADPNCNMGYVTGNGYSVSVSWAEHYGCWGKAATQAAYNPAPAPAPAPVGRHKRAHAAHAADPMCSTPYATGNGYSVSVSWAEHYGCWGGSPRM
jgi:hypothetical protein